MVANKNDFTVPGNLTLRMSGLVFKNITSTHLVRPVIHRLSIIDLLAKPVDHFGGSPTSALKQKKFKNHMD